MAKSRCRKGKGTEERKYADRCYWYYNGECIKPEKEPCYYGRKK